MSLAPIQAQAVPRRSSCSSERDRWVHSWPRTRADWGKTQGHDVGGELRTHQLRHREVYLGAFPGEVSVVLGPERRKRFPKAEVGLRTLCPGERYRQRCCSVDHGVRVSGTCDINDWHGRGNPPEFVLPSFLYGRMYQSSVSPRVDKDARSKMTAKQILVPLGFL